MQTDRATTSRGSVIPGSAALLSDLRRTLRDDPQLRRMIREHRQLNDDNRLVTVKVGPVCTKRKLSRCPACGRMAVQTTMQRCISIRQGNVLVCGRYTENMPGVKRAFTKITHRCTSCGCNPLKIPRGRRKALLKCMR